MEFINVRPSSSAGASRQIHSHAARTAHARARRLRMANYMREQNKKKESQELATIPSEDTKSSFDRDEARPLVPRIIPGAFEHEPLASFIRSLDPKEVFMFDHCK